MKKRAVAIEVSYGKNESGSHFVLPLTELGKKLLIKRISSGDYKKIRIKTKYDY